MFAPRSAALVGATDSTTSFGGRVFRQMTGFGFAGRSTRSIRGSKEIGGLTCYPSLKDLPETPDHVGIIVSTERVFDVLADCAALGVPFVDGLQRGILRDRNAGRPRAPGEAPRLRARVGHAHHGAELQRRHQLRRCVRDDVDRGDHGAARAAGQRRHRQPERRAWARSTSCGARRRSGSASATRRAPATKPISTRSISRASCCARKRPTSC